MKTDNLQRYGSITRFLHWTMAVCYLFMFGTAVAWNMNENLKFLMNPHKAMGILLLLLSVIRVLWGLTQSFHRPKNGITAKLGHWALYALMVAVPAMGMARQVGFGSNNQSLIDLGNNFHGALAWVLLLLVVGHIGMVWVHKIKGESIMPRMYGKS